jgi:hypothetical protein
MSFIFREPLPANSDLFQGRQREIAEILNAFRGGLEPYQLIYGPRLSGKTSLLLRLRARVTEQANTHACWVDFQQVPEALPVQALLLLAQKIGEAVGFPGDHPLVPKVFPHGGQEFPTWLSKLPFEGKLVLLLEELGALSTSAKRLITGLLRSMFNQRSGTSLERVMVVVFGGIELHELVSVNSSFANICRVTVLPDLGRQDTIALLEAGFPHKTRPAGLDLEKIGSEVFNLVTGHPYLTQRLAQLMLEQTRSPGWSDAKWVGAMAEMLLGDAYFGDLFQVVSQYQLNQALPRLLAGECGSSEDSEMEQLRLLGVAKWAETKWEIRNPLLRSYLDRSKGAGDVPVPPQGLDMEPEAALVRRKSRAGPVVFISYAHKDNESADLSQKWLNRLLELWAPFARELNMKLWWDKEIRVGDDWQEKIQAEIRSARAAVLLVSPAFLASDYIVRYELPVILEGKASNGLRVIPILIAPCAIGRIKVRREHPGNGPRELALADIEIAGHPTPLIEVGEAEQNRIILKVAEDLCDFFTNPQ